MLKLIKYKNYSAKISTLGANCVSLKYERACGLKAARIIREPKIKEDESSFLFGIPILFPPNRTDGGNFLFNGRQYRFPLNDEKNGCSLHGDVNVKEFSVTDEGENYVCMRLSENFFGGVFQPHDIIVSYALGEGGLKQTVTVSNRSGAAMPLALGFHTSFAVPFLPCGDAGDIVVYADVESEIERNERFLPTGRTFKTQNSRLVFCANKNVSVVCKAAKYGKIKISDEKNDVFVEYSPDEKFLYRVFFNGGAKNFICAEAQSCNVNALKTQSENDGFMSLEPLGLESFVSYIKFCK